MDFTREPIIETIVTPKEGYKLVVRSSKNVGQEEYLVDAVELVTFGHSHFFRSLERPKAFLLPVTDYELLEVREARMVLKNVGFERAIKIGGGREHIRPPREIEKEEEEEAAVEVSSSEQKEGASLRTDQLPPTMEGRAAEGRGDRKRERRRQQRKRRGREERTDLSKGEEEGIEGNEREEETLAPAVQADESSAPAPVLSPLLQPPPLLISETINLYRQNDLFKGAFYIKEEERYQPHEHVQALLDEEDEESISHHEAEEKTVDHEEEAQLTLETEEEEHTSKELPSS